MKPSGCRREAMRRIGALGAGWAAGPLGLGLLGEAALVRAQAAWPGERPIRLIAPVQPGGGVDLVARTMAERLGRALGATFVVENISGGGGVIASTTVAGAAPDGHTLMIGYVGTHGTNPAVRKLPYDAVKDFTAIGMVGGTPNVLVVGPALPVTSVKDLLTRLRAEPGRLSYGSAGTGTLTHLAMEQFKLATATFMVHIPYRGIGPAIVDCIGGQTHAMLPGLAAAMPHIRSGKLRPLAVTGARRHALIADVPTLDELGYKGFDGVQWYGIVGPANMPAPIVKRLNEEIVRQIALPELRERLAVEALETMPMSADEFATYIRDDIARWAKLVRERNIQIE